MSELGLGVDDDDDARGEEEDDYTSHRKGRGCGVPGCLAVLLALAIVIGGGYFALSKGIDSIKNSLGGPEDYPGPGTGQVLVEVHKGDSGADIGNTLKSKGVVKSVGAFTDAYAANPDAQSIQVGFYELQRQMKASDAVEILVDHNNLIETTITIPEGLRVEDTIAILADKTDFSKKQFNKALQGDLGLPAFAKGNPEGYLFPATYAFPPKSTPESMLSAMVDRWRQAANEADLAGASKELGYTQAELMTIASLVQAEARGDDMAKVARVIYNRLDTPGYPTFGKLEIDATVNYALGRNLGVALSEEDLAVDSPYNTRKYAGLPPGPIESPGDDAIYAATHPADGNWLFYVTVNLKTGETKFTDDYDTFLKYTDEFHQYCETSDAC